MVPAPRKRGGVFPRKGNMSKQKKHPLVLAHVNIYKGDVLTVCNADGSKLHPAYLTGRNKGEYTVSHWDDTWLYYGDGEKGDIDWLFYRIIEEGKKPTNSDPAMFKRKQVSFLTDYQEACRKAKKREQQ